MMAGADDKEWRNLAFSQREGKVSFAGMTNIEFLHSLLRVKPYSCMAHACHLLTISPARKSG